MMKRDVMFSLSDYAQDFILEYKNADVPQDVIDAIVVDYINYYATTQCCLDLAFYTQDLRSNKKHGYGYVDKGVLLSSLNHRKDEYAKIGIIKSVNINCHMNECSGKAKSTQEEAISIVNSFIEAYMNAE